MPLPVHFKGSVVPGFGRGGKQLNCPTANLDDSVVNSLPEDLKLGVYFGLAKYDGKTYSAAMSFGKNPQFKNEKKSFEVNLIGYSGSDFYGQQLEGVVLGYIRESIAFNGIAELRDAIANDIEFAKEKTVGRMDELSKL